MKDSLNKRKIKKKKLFDSCNFSCLSGNVTVFLKQWGRALLWGKGGQLRGGGDKQTVVALNNNVALLSMIKLLASA